MGKRSKILSIIAIFFLIVIIINISNLISKRNWVKTEAVVTSVLLPDGTVCGDFTDINGVKHIDEPLFPDFKFQQANRLRLQGGVYEHKICEKHVIEVDIFARHYMYPLSRYSG